MKKKKLFITITSVAATLIMCATLFAGCSLFGRGDVNDLADQLYSSVFSNDALSANFFFEDADKALGITPEVSLSSPSSKSDYETGYAAYQTQAALMAVQYKYSKMSDADKELFTFLQEFFKQQSKFADYYYLQDDYIGGYTGMQANLPIYLTEYKFRDKQDIEDYIKLCELTVDTFPTWVTYEQARLDNGYGRMKFVLDYALEQCEGFTGVDISDTANLNPYDTAYVTTDNFVLTNAISKLNDCDYLTAAEKQSYDSRLRTAINNKVIPAYLQLGVSLNNLINLESNASKFARGGLAAYGDVGRNYYQTQLNSSTGTFDSVSTVYNNSLAAFNQTVTVLETLRNQISTTYHVDPDEAVAALFTADSANWTNNTALNNTVSELKGKLASSFPAMAESEGSVVLKNVDESLKDYYSPAAYFVSALDNNNADEVIIINSWDDTGYISYDLLSHEGIPGHLYQYNYLKNSNQKGIVKVLCPTSYKEGWATYAEHYMAGLYDEVGSLNNLLMQYQVKLVLARGYLRVISDILINYEGYASNNTYEGGVKTATVTYSVENWLETVAQVKDDNDYNFLLPVDGEGNRYLVADYANNLAANAILSPCNAATYYYSYLQVSNIVTALKNKGYSEYDAHKAILDSPYTFAQIKDKYDI